MFRRFLLYNFRLVFASSQWVKRRFTQAGKVVLGSLIAASVFGIDTRQTFGYQLFALLFALLLLAWISSWFFRPRLFAKRHLPQFVTVDETINYRVTVENHSARWQRHLTLLENLRFSPPDVLTFQRAKEPGQRKRNRFDDYVGYPRWAWLMYISQGAEITEQILPILPPATSLQQPGEIDFHVTLKPLRRGYIYFTGMTFACPDPLGLFNALYHLPLPNSLLVLPKRYPVGEIRLPGSRKYQRGGINLAMSVGDSEEFMSLREYRPGDPLRHIHWKSWAKTGEPVVKEFQDEFFVRHALILDTFTDQYNGQAFESAVSVAASLACAPRSHEVLLDLMLVGTQAYCFTSGRGLSHTGRLLEILACVEACPGQSFTRLYPLIQEHAHSISGAICILLNWNTDRQQLVHFLKQAGIPLLIVIISDQLLAELPADAHCLTSDKLAEGLAKLV